jgi:hypothetical protein
MMPAQPASSSTTPVPHWKVGEQVPSTRLPWQVAGVVHVGGRSKLLQSLPVAQQKPLWQQKPFSQWLL